jgi:hypothetical protein
MPVVAVAARRALIREESVELAAGATVEQTALRVRQER